MDLIYNILNLKISEHQNSLSNFKTFLSNFKRIEPMTLFYTFLFLSPLQTAPAENFTIFFNLCLQFSTQKLQLTQNL